jgi:hypothetical protein
MAKFLPVLYIDGHLPIEDHGLIGDGTTAALVGRDGAISWMCVPRFDSPPLLCRILDTARGESDTGVLVTEMRSQSGLVRVTDALTIRSGADLIEDAPAGRCELLRSVSVLEGRLVLRIQIEPRGGGRAESVGRGLRLHCVTRPEIELQLLSTGQLDGLETRRWGRVPSVTIPFRRTTFFRQRSMPGVVGCGTCGALSLTGRLQGLERSGGKNQAGHPGKILGSGGQSPHRTPRERGAGCQSSLLAPAPRDSR